MPMPSSVGASNNGHLQRKSGRSICAEGGFRPIQLRRSDSRSLAGISLAFEAVGNSSRAQRHANHCKIVDLPQPGGPTSTKCGERPIRWNKSSTPTSSVTSKLNSLPDIRSEEHTSELQS